LKIGLELDGEIFSGGDKGEENKKCGGRGKEKSWGVKPSIFLPPFSLAFSLFFFPLFWRVFLCLVCRMLILIELLKIGALFFRDEPASVSSSYS